MTKKKTLHVVFKTHLDIGFTDLAERVVDQYLFDYLPRAVSLAEKLPQQFIWTTGSWLIDYYLRSDKIAEAEKIRLKKVIASGNICWHGLPFTTHTELMDKELLEYGLSIGGKLDKAFGKTTIAAKLTDVPGHTRGMIGPLKQAGIDYLHIGVNASSAVPEVPKLFLWRFNEQDLIVHYAEDYGEVFLGGEDWTDGLYFAHTHDNDGPPKSEREILQLFEKLENEYPDYVVIPSTLDAYAAGISQYRSQLPVIEQEIGDSWIHGIASDPLKISRYEQLLALRTKWLLSGELDKTSESYRAFSNQLLLVPEHTWGGNGNVFLPDYRNYLLSDFQKARQQDRICFNKNRKTMDYADLMAYISTDIEADELAAKRSYQYYEQSWAEQRNYLAAAAAALPEKLQKELAAHEQQRMFQQPPLTSQPIILGRKYRCDSLELTFGSSGEITKMKSGGYNLLAGEQRFGKLSYERYDQTDYQQFFADYSRLNQQTSCWALGDFGKRGIEAWSDIYHEVLSPYVEQGVWYQQGSCWYFDFVLSYEKEACKKWGLPETQRLVYRFDSEQAKLHFHYTYQGKQANRMPEAYWLETSIHTETPALWQMHKLNQRMPLVDTVKQGSRSLHCLSSEGLSYQDHHQRLQLQSFDAPLFSIGGRQLLQFTNKQPDTEKGMFINLHNNVWGTNFPAWFEGDMVYEGCLSLS